MASSRYVKAALDNCSINLMGGTIVGQGDGWILVERPEPKKRSKQDVPRRKRRTKAEMEAGPTEQERSIV